MPLPPTTTPAVIIPLAAVLIHKHVLLFLRESALRCCIFTTLLKTFRFVVGPYSISFIGWFFISTRHERNIFLRLTVFGTIKILLSSLETESPNWLKWFFVFQNLKSFRSLKPPEIDFDSQTKKASQIPVENGDNHLISIRLAFIDIKFIFTFYGGSSLSYITELLHRFLPVRHFDSIFGVL